MQEPPNPLMLPLYNFKPMASDLAEMTDAEGLGRVIVTGHDWGSPLAQRLYLFQPARVAGIILLNVACNPPTPNGPPFNLDTRLAIIEKSLGRAVFAYWQLFGAPGGPKILQELVDSLGTALHAASDERMKEIFCTRDALREYLLTDKRKGPVKHYAQDPSAREVFISRMQRDGFEGPQCRYRAVTENHHYEVGKSLPPKRLQVGVPMLFIGCTNDPVDSGHWVMREKAAKVEEAFRESLKTF